MKQDKQFKERVRQKLGDMIRRHHKIVHKDHIHQLKKNQNSGGIRVMADEKIITEMYGKSMIARGRLEKMAEWTRKDYFYE